MAAKLSILEKIRMFAFLKSNIENPLVIIEEYKKEPEKWETLKVQHPEYREYIGKYPELVKKLKEAGIPL